MLLDIFIETQILTEWTIVWLNLPILAHSAINPWIYAFHHGEMRVAAGKIAEDMVGVFGITPSNYGCSPARRDSNTNVELDDVNSCEGRRVAIENCFAAKQHHHHYHCSRRRCTELSGRHLDISPEADDSKSISGNCCQIDVIEEDARDLAKMLDPNYVIDRNHMIDSNHNIDKIKNLKYLLDPTFSKIRHLRRLNHKRCGSSAKSHEPQSISYQNLGCGALKKLHEMNTMSEPVLNCPVTISVQRSISKPRNASNNLSSVSDPNIKDTTTLSHKPKSTQSLHPNRCNDLPYQRKRLALGRSRIVVNKMGSRTLDLPPHDSSCLSLPNPGPRSNRSSPLQRLSPNRHVDTSYSRLTDFYNEEQGEAEDEPTRLPGIARESEVFVNFKGPTQARLLEPYNGNFLTRPVVHSEPSSPIGLLSINYPKLGDLVEDMGSNSSPESLTWQTKSPSPTRFSDPEYRPSVLLNIEDCSEVEGAENLADSVDPDELTEALLLERIRGFRLPEPVFSEHNSTRLGGAQLCANLPNFT